MPMTRHPRPANTSTRRWPVRLILIGIVFALVGPSLIFCGVLLNRIAYGERTRSLETAQAAASRTAETLDRELSNLTAALLALATSPALDTDDLASFRLQARAVSEALQHDIILCDPEGRVAATVRDLEGGRQPLIGSVETVRLAGQTRRPVVSGLFRSRVSQLPTLAVDVPVLRDGTVRYVLALSVRASSLSDLLSNQSLPDGWVASVTDASDHVVARNLRPDKFVGGFASPDVRRHGVGDHAAWVGNTLEATPVLAAMQRQHLADWRVTVGVPLSTIEAPLHNTITLLGVTGVITLAFAGLLAWQLADTVAGPLRRLARAGDELAQGLPVQGVRSSIAEVDAVSRALVQATHDLRARAETLAAERAQLAAIIETVPVGLMIAEAPGGRIVSGNSKLADMLRHPVLHGAGEAAQAEWIAHHPDGRRVRPEEFPLAQVMHGAAHAELRCIYQRGDGTPLWVQFIAAPILAADGTLTGGVVATLDIDDVVRAREAEARLAASLEAQVADRTAALESANQRLRDEMQARTAAEEQLRQAQKMEAVGQLTGGIAHDFNNLLTIIVGNLDLLRRRVSEDAAADRTRRLLDNALEGSSRAATLVARLLAFSRRQPLAPQPLDANHLVAGMSDLLRRTLGEAIRVETVLAEGLWQANADPNQLENALLNLAVNSRDAMLARSPSGGVLTITTSNVTLGAAELDPGATPGDYVRLCVSDTGLGMSPDVAARVFEPFYTTKPQGQGTGLGLSQVHGFVKQSGGHVALRTTPGQGTAVTIDLPRCTTVVAAPRPSNAPAVMPGRPLTVLTVEDEPAVRRTSTEALRELGHTVLEACDAPAGLSLLAAHPETDILFTDVMLPAMSGFDLAAEARRCRPGLPVLYTSGYTGPHPDLPLPAGQPMLRKPFTLEELAHKLDEAVHQP